MTFFFNKNPAFKLFIPEFISELENSDQKSKVEQTFASEIQNVTGNSGLEKLENYMNSVTNITDTLDSSYRQKAIETYLNDAMIKSLNKEEVLGITYNLTCGDWKNVDDTVKASIVQKLSTQREQLNNQLNNVSIQKSETDTLLNKNKAPDDCYTLFTDPIQKTKLIDLLTQNSKNNKEENRMFNTFSPEEFASKAPLNVLIEILKISDVINEKIKEKNNQEQDKTSTNQSKGLFGEACNAFYSLINLLYEIFFKNIVNALDAILPENTEQKAERQFRTNLKALKHEFESCATNQISREKPSAQTVTNSNEKLKHSDKFHREVNSFRDMVTKTTVHNSEKSH